MKRNQQSKLKSIFNSGMYFPGFKKKAKLDEGLKEFEKLKIIFNNSDLNFRKGFPERTTTRLINILNAEPVREFYASLSSFLPKIVYSSAAIILICITTLFIIHGEFSLETLMGAEQIDDSNFISYLIFENNN
jgi:hypothetical protein